MRLIFFTALLLPLNLSAAEWIVSPGGNDAASGGTEATAFRSIQRAATFARFGDTVRIKAGTYRETVTPAADGTAAQPITYQAFGDGPVTISGSEPVTGWTLDGGQVWRAPMAGDFFSSATPGDGVHLYDANVKNHADQVFWDQRMVLVSRWPNTPSQDPSDPVKAAAERFISKTRSDNWTTGVMEDDELAALPDASALGAEVAVQPSSDSWSWTFTGYISAKSGTRLTWRSRNNSGKGDVGGDYDPKSRYILFNSRALIDSAGEWFHDKGAGQLYLQSLDGGSPEGRVEAKRRVYGFDLSNRAYTVLSGLRFFACTVTTDREAGGDQIGWDASGNERYPWRGAGNPAASHHVTLRGLEVLYPSHYTDVSGHFFMQWGLGSGVVLSGADHRIENSVVRWSAGNGIGLHGPRHKCLNNVILDSDYAATECAAINTVLDQDGSPDQEIANNSVLRTGRSGLRLNDLNCSVPASFAASVHHNEVLDWAMQDFDLGAFYHAGHDGRFLRIHHNRFGCNLPRPGMVFGPYFDWSKNVVLDHNLVWGVGGSFQRTNLKDGQSNLIVAFNTFQTNDSLYSTSVGSYGSQAVGCIFHNNIAKVSVFPTPPNGSLVCYYPRYDDPDFAGGIASVVRNLVWGDDPAAWRHPFDVLNPNDFYTANRPYVAAPSMALSADSPAIDQGSLFGSVVRDGVTVSGIDDPVIGAAPDVGAREYGATQWAAGSTLPGLPATPTVTPGPGSLMISWASVINATSYSVEVRGADGVWRIAATTSGLSSTITGLTAGLTAGKSVLVQIRASNAVGSGLASTPVSAIPGATAPSGTGTGLTGTYFSGTALAGAGLSRTDAMVDFDWGTGSPMAGLPVDGFSVRWTGQVQAQASETYTFTTLSDDGVRLWVNGQQLVDNWADHGPTENSGTIALVAGQKYDVKMEFYENSGGATAKLSWASASTAKQIIPMAQLFPSGGGNGLPAGWTAQDVGSVTPAGSTTQSNGTWTVSGSGADIWSTADGFQFAWRQVTGDVQVTARVTGLDTTNAWAKAGVMIRESLAPGSRHASAFATAGNGTCYQRRKTTDAASVHTAGPLSAVPVWLRIERSGSQLTVSTSLDGSTWAVIRRETVTMGAAVYVGLAVTSHNNGVLCTGTFTNVQVVAAAAAAN